CAKAGDDDYGHYSFDYW
nr:immunoglobulin heavy chain junction region [Macaca mulatta]